MLFTLCKQQSSKIRSFWSTFVVATLLVTSLTACGGQGGTQDDKNAASSETNATLTVITNDSWKLAKADITALEEAIGAKVKFVNGEESGTLDSKLILRKANPLGDAVVGLTANNVIKIAKAGVLDDQKIAAPKGGEKYQQAYAPRPVPMDRSDVCFNYDLKYFSEHKLPVPQNLDDIVKPEYKDLVVVQSPAESDTGFGLLLATRQKYGDQFVDYWKKLVANGTKVVNSWSDAWEQEYTQGGGKGTRPIVMSYSSSPYWTINKAGTEATTGNVPGSCYPAVSYGAVLKNAKHPQLAKKFLVWMTSAAGQEANMRSNITYPISSDAKIDEALIKFAPRPENDQVLPAEEIEAKRQEWISAVLPILGGK